MSERPTSTPDQQDTRASLVEEMGLRRERIVGVRDLVTARNWKAALTATLIALVVAACLV